MKWFKIYKTQLYTFASTYQFYFIYRRFLFSFSFFLFRCHALAFSRPSCLSAFFVDAFLTNFSSLLCTWKFWSWINSIDPKDSSTSSSDFQCCSSSIICSYSSLSSVNFLILFSILQIRSCKFIIIFDRRRCSAFIYFNSFRRSCCLRRNIKIMNLPAPEFCCSNSDERLEANGVKKLHIQKNISINFNTLTYESPGPLNEENSEFQQVINVINDVNHEFYWRQTCYWHHQQ